MEKLATVLFTEAGAVAGVLMLVVIGLYLALRSLWNDYKKMQVRHETRNAEVIEEATRTMERMQSAMREQTSTIELLARSNT